MCSHDEVEQTSPVSNTRPGQHVTTDDGQTKLNVAQISGNEGRVNLFDGNGLHGTYVSGNTADNFQLTGDLVQMALRNVLH